MTKRTPAEPEQMNPIKDGGSQREGAADKKERAMETTREMGHHTGDGEGLDARLQAQIGYKLKAMYDDIANEPIPDKFLDLLRKLDGQERGN